MRVLVVEDVEHLTTVLLLRGAVPQSGDRALRAGYQVSLRSVGFPAARRTSAYRVSMYLGDSVD